MIALTPETRKAVADSVFAHFSKPKARLNIEDASSDDLAEMDFYGGYPEYQDDEPMGVGVMETLTPDIAHERMTAALAQVDALIMQGDKIPCNSLSALTSADAYLGEAALFCDDDGISTELYGIRYRVRAIRQKIKEGAL